MSSEKEESTEHVDEPNTNSDPNLDQSEDLKGNGLGEHAKPKKRRRGKKRKQRKESAATCEAENHEECENELHAESDHENQGECDSPEWGSDDSLNCNYDSYSDVMIRPINVPKAPLNSTQFIMDDHDDCRFYMSFERSPNSYHSFESRVDEGDGDIVEPIGEDAAYIDIDYQYESPQDFDNSAYNEKEFELSYKNNRFEDLMRLPRNDLIARLQTLETRYKELNDDLTKEDPSPILEKLQTELLELQEKNSYLKEYNSKLTALLHSETDCSDAVSSSVLKEPTSVSNDDQESEESEKEVFEDCYQTVNEVVMSEINTESETVCDACDKNTEVQFGESASDFKDDDCDRAIHHGEDSNQMSDSNENIDQNKEDIDLPLDQSELESRVLFKNSEPEDCPSSSTAVINAEDKIMSLIHTNSVSLHRQQNNLVKDDLRTLNISSSDLFHIANQTKCSSSVPREGGMSPSETSVN